MATALKTALEDLLKERRLQAEAPPLRGVDRRLRPLASGIPEVDRLLGGGFPRGQISEVHGPRSSGRTGLACAVAARATGEGSLVAWVDAGDHLDPATASAAGVDLTRLFWLRGGDRVTRALPRCLSALGTLLSSGLFDLVVLDVAGMAVRHLPNAVWIRLGRMLESTPTALLVLGREHVACGPRGASLALRPAAPRWSGQAGPGRLFQGLEVEATAGRHALRRASFALQAVH